jgi:organic hydroperoxide reductase OsmC/OhrA
MKEHTYDVRVTWTGNTGEGTKTYRSYRRDHEIASREKPAIAGSSDPAFLGDPSRYSPEELLVSTLSSCHMLWYLHLSAVNRIVVREYEDRPFGKMRENDDGSGEFTEVTLNPRVKLGPGSDVEKANALHAEAHRFCFIARSVNFPVKLAPQFE